MSTLETIKLDIDEKAYSYARIYASLLNDEYQRKRAYASIVALYSFLNKLEQTPYNVQKSMTLFRNPILNEQYEITDVYVNNWHLEIRVVTDGNAFLVPKIHYEENLLPDFYVVVKVDKDLKNAELVGIYDTKEDKDEPYDYNYRAVSFSALMSYDEFLNKIYSPKAETTSEADKTFFNENYLGLMDNDISDSAKNRLVKLLFENSELRTEFCCFTGFEMVSSNSSKYDDLFNDNMLGIVGANDVDLPKYEGKEEQIYIGDDNGENNQPENKGDEEPEETVADILDELFGADEETIEPSAITEKPIETVVEQTNNLVEKTKKDTLPDNILEENDTITSLDEDLQIITDAEPQNLVLDKEDEIIEFIDDNQGNIRPMGAVDYIDDTTATEETSDDIQKVIVDYDESGEPIYSYITNVDNNETDLFADIDAEIVEEEPLKTEESLIEEINDIEDISEENPAEEKISEIETIEEIPEEESSDNTDYEYFDDEKFEDSAPFNAKEEEISVEEYPETNEIASENEDDNLVDFAEDEVAEKGIPLEESESSVTDSEEAVYNEDENLPEEEQKEDDETVLEDSEETTDGEETEYDEEGGEYEDSELETPEEDTGSNSKKKLVAGIVGGIVALGLIGGGTALYLNHSKAEKQVVNAPVQENNQQDNMFEPSNDNEGFNPEGGDGQDFFGGEEGIPAEENANENQGNPEEQQAAEENQPQENADMPQLTENDLLAQNNNPEGDVNKAMVNSFAPGGGSSVSLRGLNWFCATELFTDNAFKNYLQNLDNTLKQNLKNNLMSATENPSNNSVEAKFAVNNNGNLEKVIISNSSGSQEIDDLVLRSINETFEGEKSQILDNSAQKSDKYYLKVVIKL